VNATLPPPGLARAELARVRRGARAGTWIEAVGLALALLAAYALPSFAADRLLRLEAPYRALLLASFVAVLARQLQRRLVRPLRTPLGDVELALAVERGAPEIRQSLVSSLQFAQELHGGAPARGDGSPALKAAVVADVQGRLAGIPFAQALDAGRMRRFGGLGALALLAFAGWAAIDASALRIWAARNLLLGSVEWPRYTSLALAAGDAAAVRLPQGDALTVRVVVTGPAPDQLAVDYRFAGGETGSETMSRTGEREFAWTIESVLADVQLAITGGDSLPLVVTAAVVERPRVDGLAVRVDFPAYMEREPWTPPPSEGELRVPRGAVLTLTGGSQKPLREAFALLGQDGKVALALAADGRTFAGEVRPETSGPLVVDVVDADALGAGAPPKLALRVGDDKPPSVEFRLRGIGAAITTHARIPGELRLLDDFGLRAVGASWRAVADQPLDKGQAPPPEAPFAAAGLTLRAPLPKSALRHETEAQVDLAQWNTAPDEAAPGNPIRPGMLFSLRLSATDNFGPGAPHEAFAEAMTFRVVTRERLAEELRRRQLEQRQELQRILDEEQRSLTELTEIVALAQAGERRAQVEARCKTLARQQQTLGRRVAFVGESYQRILWEYENNRLWEANQVRQVEGLVPAPLAALAKDDFPATARQVDAYARSGDEAVRAAAAEGYRAIARRLAAVLKQMEEAESLAALIEDLRSVIKLETEAIRDVEGRVRQNESEFFQPKKPADRKEPPK
jgi:hypothetical protein